MIVALRRRIPVARSYPAGDWTEAILKRRYETTRFQESKDGNIRADANQPARGGAAGGDNAVEAEWQRATTGGR